MKQIAETIDRLPPGALDDLGLILNIKKATAKSIASSFNSITGIDAVISSLSRDEIAALKTVYKGKDGITFGEIEKEIGQNIAAVDLIVNILTRKLLVYPVKNRQLLNKKMDKVYCIAEVASILKIVEPEFIKSSIDNVFEKVSSKKIKNDHKTKDSLNVEILKSLIEHGGVMELAEAETLAGRDQLNKVLAQMHESDLLSVKHVVGKEFKTILLITDTGVILASSMEGAVPGNVHNRYFFVQNMLTAYDTISTFGLFLTKQMEFRKIDKRRIADSIFSLEGIKGEIDSEVSADLALNIMYKMGCLRVHKDIASVSLSKISKDLDHPQKILYRVFRTFDDNPGANQLFPPPYDMPSFDSMIELMSMIHDMKSISFRQLRVLGVLSAMMYGLARSPKDFLYTGTTSLKSFESTFEMLLLLGIIKVKDGEVSLSDVGDELAAHFLKTKPQAAHVASKCIYINPDFSLIIPVADVPSASLYAILTHTEITRNDIILNAVITRSSIVRANKRGMSQKRFTETLKEFSKNEIPQNLSFLLTEWANQTIRITITKAVLLQTNHTTFIDELMYGKTKTGVIERLSPVHVLIRKDHIDEIVKLARKNDAVISMFEDDDDEGF